MLKGVCAIGVYSPARKSMAPYRDNQDKLSKQNKPNVKIV